MLIISGKSMYSVTTAPASYHNNFVWMGGTEQKPHLVNTQAISEQAMVSTVRIQAAKEAFIVTPTPQPHHIWLIYESVFPSFTCLILFICEGRNY